jgi:hypothetical protein
MLVHSRWCTAESAVASADHVRAHLSSIATPDDDPDRYATDVVITVAAEGDGLQVTGRLDREVVADYLRDDFDPFLGVPQELRAEADT